MSETPLEVWIATPEAHVREMPSFEADEDSDVEQHSRRSALVEALQVDSQQFLAGWASTLRAVQALFDKQDQTDGPFYLESLTAKLSINGKGRVVFVGELGGEVAFEAHFARRRDEK